MSKPTIERMREISRDPQITSVDDLIERVEELALTGEPTRFIRDYHDWYHASGGRRVPDGMVDYGLSYEVESFITADIDGIHRWGRGGGGLAYYLSRFLIPARKAAKTRARRGSTGSGRPRDSMRSKVYAAEDAALRSFGQRFTTVGECQSYIDKMVASAWWKRRWPRLTSITVEPGRGARHAFQRGRRVYLPKAARSERIILHEVAHVIGWHEDGRSYDRCAAHGREFCATMLTLVRWKLGDEAWRALKAAFVERRIKHTAPRKRQMTEEQKRAAVERLAKAREVLAAKKQEG